MSLTNRDVQTLGVLSATPYLTGSDASPAAMLTAAWELAYDLTR